MFSFSLIDVCYIFRVLHFQMTDLLTSRLLIACGSYDGTVFAMSYDPANSQENGPSRLKAEFIDPEAHTVPVSALAVCGDTVASGSGDEAIQVVYQLSFI